MDAAIFVAARQAAMPWLPDLHDPDGIRRYFAADVAAAEVLLVRDADAPAGFLALRGETIEHLYVDPAAHGNEEREPDMRVAWSAAG